MAKKTKKEEVTIPEITLSKKELAAIAKELNKALGLNPAIDIKGTLEELVEKINEAAALLVPEDELSAKTVEGLGKLGIELPMVGPDSATEDTEDDEEGAENGAEEDEEEEEIKPAKKTKKEKKEEPAKKEPKKAKDPEPAKKPVTKITKKSIVEQFIDSKKGGTIEQMAEAIVTAGIDPDYEKNLKIVKLWLSKMGFKVTKAAMEQNPIFKR